MATPAPDENKSATGDVPDSEHLWRMAGAVCVIFLLVTFGEIYLRMAVGVAIFSLFIPRKAWSQIGPLLGLLAICGVPTLLGGLKAANFLILNCLYGPEQILNGTLHITHSRTFIQMSNGDEFHGVQLFLWRAATLVVIAVVGLTWIQIVRAVSKRVWPAFHSVLEQFWARVKSSQAAKRES